MTAAQMVLMEAHIVHIVKSGTAINDFILVARVWWDAAATASAAVVAQLWTSSCAALY
jgi:hypothetical protein